jgi:hypothetical protein
MSFQSAAGWPQLGTADECRGYLARPDDMAWREVRVGKAAPQVTGRGDMQGAQFYAVAGMVYEEACGQGVGDELPTGGCCRIFAIDRQINAQQ